jgi:hypothetical protein
MRLPDVSTSGQDCRPIPVMVDEANVSANVIMAKTGHKSLRSVQRYVRPGLAAVHTATEALSSPRRRG